MIIVGALSIQEIHNLAYELRSYYLLQIYSCIVFDNDQQTQMVVTKKDTTLDRAPVRQRDPSYKSGKVAQRF